MDDKRVEELMLRLIVAMEASVLALDEISRKIEYLAITRSPTQT